jgi:hypothetical protein
VTWLQNLQQLMLDYKILYANRFSKNGQLLMINVFVKNEEYKHSRWFEVIPLFFYFYGEVF